MSLMDVLYDIDFLFAEFWFTIKVSLTVRQEGNISPPLKLSLTMTLEMYHHIIHDQLSAESSLEHGMESFIVHQTFLMVRYITPLGPLQQLRS